MTDNNKKTPKIKIVPAPEAKPLDFGAVFLAWTSEKQIDYLKKLASSQNHALDLMQKERDKLLAENAVLQAQVENADKSTGIIKNTMQNAILAQNDKDQEFAKRIQELEAQLRTYRQIVKLVKDNGN